MASSDPARSAFLAARDVNLLSDPDRFKRRRALDSVTKELFEGQNKPSPAVRTAIVLQDLHKPLLALAADTVESNREATISLFTRTVEEDAGSAPVALPALLPVFTSRVGRLPLAEEAEELRVQLARVLNILLSRTDVGPSLAPRVADVADVIKALSSDAFHSVKVEAGLATSHLARALPDKVHLVMGILAHAAVGNLGHQRGPVRIVALSALHACLPCGSESLPTLLSDPVLPAVSSLRFDRTPSVRKQAAVTVADWLATLPAHALEAHEHRLLHIMCGLIADDTPEVCDVALTSFEKAARARANAAAAAGGSPADARAVPPDMAAAAEAAAPDASIAGYAASAALAQRMVESLREGGGGAVSGPTSWEPTGAAAAAAAAAGILPGPFKHRPCHEGILLAQRLLPSVLPLVLSELGDWTARIRLAGASALRSLVILTENAATGHLDKILSALITGSRDDDVEVRRMLGHVGRLLGVYTTPSAQLSILLPVLRGEVHGFAGNAMHAASTLAVLAAVLSSASADAMAPHVQELATTLCLPALAEHEPPGLRTQLAQALTFTIATGVAGQKHGPGGRVDIDSPTLDGLLLALLHLQDLSAPIELVNTAQAAEASLSKALRFPSVDHMYASAVSRLLPRITASSKTWVKSSHDRRVFDTLLRAHRAALCGATSAEAAAALSLCVDTFVAVCDPGKEPEVKVSMLALLDSFVAGPEEGRVQMEGGGEHSTASSPTGSHRGTPQTLGRALEATVGDTGMAVREGVPVSAHSSEMAVRAALSGGGFGHEGHAVSPHLVDALLADGLGGRLVMEVLLPNMVWRVGLVASTVRKVAVAVILALARRRLLPLATLEPIATQHMLPSLTGVSSDDDATTRHMAVSAIASLLTELAGALDYEAVRQVYPELLKRLDDSNDAVRASACTALAAFAGAAPREALTGGPVEYTLETLLVHLDDMEGGMQATVYDACLPLVRLDTPLARKLVTTARAKHRHPAYCDRLLGYIDGLERGGNAAA